MMAAIFIFTATAAVLFGGYIYFNPQRVITLQQKFYALINWRMEPISMAKEIRNTRWMGLFLVVFALISCIYYCLQ